MNEEVVFYILIPVYNVEKYISNCIDSVLNQTYQNFKIIIVDDGTPDNAGKICDEYARADARITVIHQENAGLVAARRNAISYLKNKLKVNNAYVMFLDSDDSLKENALQIVYESINKTGCDMLIFNINRVCNGEIIQSSFDKNQYVGTVTDKALLYKICFGDSSYNPLCRKAVSINILTDHDYREYCHISHREDLLQNIELYKNCKKAAFIEDSLYNYTLNPNSITQAEKYENCQIDSTVRHLVWDFLEQENVWNNSDWDEYINYCKLLLKNEVKKIMCFNTCYKNKAGLLDKIRDDEYYQIILRKSKFTDLVLFLLKHGCYTLLLFYSWLINTYRFIWRKKLKNG